MSILARIIRIEKTLAHASTPEHEHLAVRIPKRLRDEAPIVGDWVELEPPAGAGHHVVAAIRPRRSFLGRLAAGREARAQPIAANVDVAFLVQSADAFNERSLERYQAVCAAGGVRAVAVASKADLAEAPQSALAVSVVDGRGLDALRREIGSGTAVFLGPSGAGKSSIVNALLGESRLPTGEVRDDGKGRHTTTRRELIALPGGGFVIDTPGLREVALLPDADAARSPFAEIEALARGCRFSDCRHEDEPGCAVRGAVEPERLDALRKLEREAAAAARKLDARAARAEARSWGRMGRDALRAKDARRRE